MRFVYVCADFGIPIFGSKGAAVHVRELSRALRALGHEVLIISPRLGGPPSFDFDVPVIELKLRGPERAVVERVTADRAADVGLAGELRAALYAAWLRQRALPLLRRFAPDIVYERYALLATAGASLAAELGVPHVLEVNAPLADEQARHRAIRLADTVHATERSLLAAADRVIVVSPALARWAVSVGVDAGNVSVLPNAVDPERFSGQRATGSRLRARLGLDCQPVVGFVGTLRPWHDVAAVVRAVGRLRRAGRALGLLVVGDGPQRASLEELAAAEGLGDAVRYAGEVAHAEVPAYLAAMDVAALPYAAADGYFSPLKLFEYQAAGLPVVAASAGEIGHCVRDGETGALYAPGDVDALVGAVARLTADRVVARRLGMAGRRHVLDHHTWRGNARAVAELAATAIDERRRGGRAAAGDQAAATEGVAG